MLSFAKFSFLLVFYPLDLFVQKQINAHSIYDPLNIIPLKKIIISVQILN